MARSRPAKKNRPLASFRFPVDVEVYRPEFEPLGSLAHLDVEKLSRAAHAEIELGYVKTGCCPLLVRAVVRKGKVTEIRAASSAEGKPESASPGLERVLEEARRRMGGGKGRPPRLPVPVAVFMQNLGDISTETITCISICFFEHCLICCKVESTGQWMCSTRGFTIKPKPI